ncbi:MAG TPA: hypothetical protein VI216_06920, partial [Candidatus Acidoferrales bacterium]
LWQSIAQCSGSAIFNLDYREAAMQCSDVRSICFRDQSRVERGNREFLKRRRIYNRLYMRAWRADPHHRERELRNRQRWHYQRKLRSVQSDHRPFTDDVGRPVCGFCRKDPPVREVMRLRISLDAAARFVPIRVPYCGNC